MIDNLINLFDKSLRSLSPQARSTHRPFPGTAEPEPRLTARERQHVAGLMRVNHTGEICAQALYLGQALTAKLPNTKQQMQQAAEEERDHLAWCEQRLEELNARVSYLNPLWFTGAFTIGALAGLVGDRWSLGFVNETENQVIKHLQSHLETLPPQDTRTAKVLSQMQTEEEHHGQLAREAGAATLPPPIQSIMRAVSKAMTRTTYYI